MQDMFALNIVKEEREFKATKMQHANTVRLITHQMKALNVSLCLLMQIR